MAAPISDGEREKFMAEALYQLGQEKFEQASGELWLRCGPSIRKIASKPPGHQAETRKWEVQKLARRALTAEKDFFGRQEITDRSRVAVPFSDHGRLSRDIADLDEFFEEMGQ
jgi:hypothetical protein